jgi:uncharacterized protein YukE
MPERVEKLRAAIRELKHELNSAESLDEATRRALEDTAEEIEATLRADEPAELNEGAIHSRLQSTLEQFEASHPALASMLSRVIDTLGQIGI